MKRIAGRTCDGCSECCRVFDIPELDKAGGCRCPKLTRSELTPRCSIYPDRPDVCRDFECEWLRGYGPDRDKPSMTGFVFRRVWREDESQLHAFACDDDLLPGSSVIARMKRYPEEMVIWHPWRGPPWKPPSWKAR